MVAIVLCGAALVLLIAITCALFLVFETFDRDKNTRINAKSASTYTIYYPHQSPEYRPASQPIYHAPSYAILPPSSVPPQNPAIRVVEPHGAAEPHGVMEPRGNQVVLQRAWPGVAEALGSYIAVEPDAAERLRAANDLATLGGANPPMLLLDAVRSSRITPAAGAAIIARTGFIGGVIAASASNDQDPRVRQLGRIIVESIDEATR